MKRRLKKEQTKLIYIFLFTSFLFTKAQHTVLKNLNLLDVINGKTITGKAISIQNGVITQIDELAKIEITKSTKLIDLENQFVNNFSACWQSYSKKWQQNHGLLHWN